MSKNQSRSSYTFILSSLLVAIPMMASAQSICSGNKDLGCVIDTIIKYLNQALVLLIGVAVVIFVWYVIRYFIRPNTERKDANLYIMYSLIGFFVILSFWGLVNILQNTFNLKNEDNQPSSWTSFKGLFPGGSSSRTGATIGGGQAPSNSSTIGGGQTPGFRQ